MIAKNYLKHPEALRFQRELFHNGFKNSPRIMRLMECVFNFAPTAPQWTKDLARKARNLVKTWKAAQVLCNFSEPVAEAKRIIGAYYSPEGQSWSGRGLMPKWLLQFVNRGMKKEQFLWLGKDPRQMTF